MSEEIPEFLHEMLLKEYGDELKKQILEGYKLKRATTFRLNTLKANIEEVENILIKLKIEYEKSQWNNEAFIIKNESADKIKEMDIYKEGKIYLQSLSSMLPPIILNPKEKENILDMAAAPGGKTTQMASLSNNKAMITACEKNKIRAERLKYNLEKQGATRVSVMLKDARKLDNFFSFDKILLDAPCSGSGTISINNKKQCELFTEELIERSIKTQKELISKANKILKLGGTLIYSTCSILKEENENIIKEILKSGEMELMPIDKEIFKDIPELPVTIEGTMCVCPSEMYEGFFVAKLVKVK